MRAWPLLSPTLAKEGAGGWFDRMMPGDGTSVGGIHELPLQLRGGWWCLPCLVCTWFDKQDIRGYRKSTDCNSDAKYTIIQKHTG